MSTSRILQNTALLNLRGFVLNLWDISELLLRGTKREKESAASRLELMDADVPEIGAEMVSHLPQPFSDRYESRISIPALKRYIQMIKTANSRPTAEKLKCLYKGLAEDSLVYLA